MKRMTVTGWGAFWIFMVIYFCVDTWLFTKGYNTSFWQYKTEAEKKMQNILIENLKHEHGKTSGLCKDTSGPSVDEGSR